MLWNNTGLTQKSEESQMPIRVLIADGHAVVRQGLRMFLTTDPELAIVCEARDSAARCLTAPAKRH